MNMEVSPSISVITNITPNHLDIHGSYEEYIDANYLVNEINQNYDDYDFLKVFINKDKVYQEKNKKIINDSFSCNYAFQRSCCSGRSCQS